MDQELYTELLADSQQTGGRRFCECTQQSHQMAALFSV